ncbi:RnfABCDGE type electron transport complex subunit D [Dethiosulfatarculus sandiegensis]|uniref:Ion-translocating oxidoreductase complex subunit D n=1 Tax=Dethiosulfatarculus sandiegensis TaxID=1429043 RepID=A0A0D2JZB1_9BACT|nr:RnfABCDGE type electron transport complex subunit D [Dethiosulfatarculus sandiegensis]KIX14880.1 hypothetical protein X474_06960 [Dethiosulfatarculus sandiegensis]
MNNQLLTVSSSPHVLGGASVRSFNLEFLIALAPALLVGFYYFGAPAVMVVCLAAASCVATEALCNVIAKKTQNLGDLHALLTGVVLGMLLPAGVPFWLPIVGGFVAIVLGKMLFGGLGAYPMNPALIAWAALALSWPEHMKAFYTPLAEGDPEISMTLLMEFKDDVAVLEMYGMGEIWKGLLPGAIGTTCTWALLAGGVYLVVRKIIRWHIPVAVLVGTLLMSLLASYTDPRIIELGWEGFGAHLNLAWFHMGAGGLMMAAVFLATEPVSSPVTPKGMLWYGLLIGVMTVIVRHWGSAGSGAYYGVLVMSAATPLFDRLRPKVLGKPRPLY